MSNSLLSSRRVTHTHSQLTISTNIKAKKTLFLRKSPPQPEGLYEAAAPPGRSCEAGELIHRSRTVPPSRYQGEEALKRKA